MRVVKVITNDEKEGDISLDVENKYEFSILKFSEKNYSQKENSIITVGTFDGLHLGHRKILETLVSKGTQLNLRKTVITFEPHPRLVLKNKHKKEIKLLSTINEKLLFFELLGIDTVFIINFTEGFSKTPAINFYENYLLDTIGLKYLIIGYDHTFGKDREGNYETVRMLSEKYNFGFSRISEFRINDEIVSSTVIRNLINNYDLEKASTFLGRNYSFNGKVVYGDRRGKTLGFPTANIEVEDKNKLIPPDGVYAVKVIVTGEEYIGMMNIGVRPTVNKKLNELKQEKFIEVHILNFDKDIYDAIITIEFIKFIRNEKKFESITELIEQLKKDKKTIELLNQ